MRWLEMVVKTLGPEADAGPGGFEAVLSAPTLDRDGEVVDAGAFDPLPPRIGIDVDHGLDVASLIGSAVPSYGPDGKLIVRGTFSANSRAQAVRQLVVEGHLSTMSAAYIERSSQKRGGVKHITKAELLNGSFVPIPSNRESLVISARSARSALEALTAADRAAIEAAGQIVRRRGGGAPSVRTGDPELDMRLRSLSQLLDAHGVVPHHQTGDEETDMQLRRIRLLAAIGGRGR